MSDEIQDYGALRQQLMDALYAAAFTGFPVALDDEEYIQNATPVQLERLADRFGLM